MKTSTNVIRPFICYNILHNCNFLKGPLNVITFLTQNVKTIIVSPDAKFENFLSACMTRQDYFTYFEESRTLGWSKTKYQ